MGIQVKDKVYYMAEHLGVPKCWVPLMLDVSDTTLTKWSYNPKNVSDEMSERIFLRLAILDQMAIKFRHCTISVDIPVRKKTVTQVAKEILEGKRGNGDDLTSTSAGWAITVNGDTYYLRDIRRRLPSDPPKALVTLARNAIVREENQHPLYIKHKYKYRTGPLSKIAQDTSLEMPLGVIRWEKDI